MSKMIERVAKALCQVDGFNPDEVGGDSFDDGLVHWKAYEVEACVAIEAMREPTDDQRNAYYELSGKTEVMMDACWERAIDAALK